MAIYRVKVSAHRRKDFDEVVADLKVVGEYEPSRKTWLVTTPDTLDYTAYLQPGTLTSAAAALSTEDLADFLAEKYISPEWFMNQLGFTRCEGQ